MRAGLIFMFVLVMSSTLAQTIPSYINPVFKSNKEKNVVAFMTSYFRESYRYELDTMCLTTAFYITFKVSATGKIADLRFTTALPELFRPFIEKMVYATEGHWTPAMLNGQAVESRPFMVLVYCRLADDKICPNIKDMTQNGTWFIHRYDKTKPRIGGYRSYDIDAVFDGIVLHPIMIGNYNIYD
jgi:hypothetical protein